MIQILLLCEYEDAYRLVTGGRRLADGAAKGCKPGLKISHSTQFLINMFPCVQEDFTSSCVYQD